MDIKKNQKFRELMNKPGIIKAAGTYDAVSARIAEKCGFDAIYMTGNGVTASLLGKPDIGLTTMTEMVTRGHQIASCINVPLICDADTGYGNINNIKRTVEEYESAGVSAIHIEDQITPKKCGAMKGLKLISAEEMVEKIKVAVNSRKDPNFTIIARTDCNSILGIEETVRRCKMYAEAGADIVFPEMLKTNEEILKVTTSVDKPVMFDIIELKGEKIYNYEELENLGVKVAINCLSAMFLISKELTNFYNHLIKYGNSSDFFDKFMDLHEYEELMGLSDENNILKVSVK